MNHFPSKKELQNMVSRYLVGQASEDEILFLENYYNYLGKNSDPSEMGNEKDLIGEENFRIIQQKINATKKPRTVTFYNYSSAAAVLIFIIGGITFFYNNRKPLKSEALAKVEKHDILPGTDKAVLTLADGSRVILDGGAAANIQDQNGIKISKTADGKLIYTIENNSPSLKKNITYNTIHTPRGGQYQVVLPDGTKVWLNAASTLKYPEVFVGNTRSVQLIGEAYFEVAKNKKLPFHVISQNQDVEVLGTHFNINGYMDDENTKTTLLEGSVKVSNQKSVGILKPGEQSVISSENSIISVIKDVDMNDETAWKNGLFQFNDTDLKNILKQLERWYDIKIDYKSIPKKRYNGMVPRRVKLSEVLKMLEKTGNIKFEIADHRQLKVLQMK